jgi:hypothetical protein
MAASSSRLAFAVAIVCGAFLGETGSQELGQAPGQGATIRKPYRDWFSEVYSTQAFRVWPVYPYVGQRIDAVLSLAADGEALWAGTTSGVARIDRPKGVLVAVWPASQHATGTLSHAVSREQAIAPGSASAILTDNWQWHLRVTKLRSGPHGRVWAKASIGALVLGADGTVVSDLPNDFEAAEALYGDRRHPGLLKWLYPVDGAGRVYLHWQGAQTAVFYDGIRWRAWRFPATALGSDKYVVDSIAQAGDRVVVAGGDYLFGAQTGLIVRPLPSGSRMAAFERGLAIAETRFPIVSAEGRTQSRAGLSFWSWGDPYGSGGYLGSLPGPSNALHEDLVVIRAADGLRYASLLGSSIGAEVCLMAEAPISSSRLVLAPGVSGRSDRAHVSALFAASDGSVWAGTADGAFQLKGAEVERFLRLWGDPASTAQEPEGTPSARVTSIAETSDGVMWFGTLRGVASYDGKRVTWYVADRSVPATDGGSQQTPGSSRGG